MNYTAISVILAYVLDLILGDPRWFPHPVRGIGWLIKKMETPLRRLINNERLAGCVLAIVIIGASWGISYTIIRGAYSLNQYLGIALSTLLIYASLAIKDLKVESMRVYYALKEQKTALARTDLSLIVGRDTENLNDKDIVRATVETVAENIVDGIISPLFYAILGGAPLALSYKAANTLDSMVSYKNDRYKSFGWASAKIDDCLNFIPARLSGIILPIACWLAGFDMFSSFKITLRDGKKNPSPNSGIPEAAVAGALGIQLGGLNFYNSIPVLKPIIGEDVHPLDIKHIKESIFIAYLSSGLFLTVGVIFLCLI